MIRVVLGLALLLLLYESGGHSLVVGLTGLFVLGVLLRNEHTIQSQIDTILQKGF